MYSLIPNSLFLLRTSCTGSPPHLLRVIQWQSLRNPPLNHEGTRHVFVTPPNAFGPALGAGR